MKILSFKSIDTNYPSDTSKGWPWSRVYEYPLILNTIEKYKFISKPRIHNTSWGFEGCHVEFKDLLEQSYDVLNSDLKPSSLPNTTIWNLLDDPLPHWAETFDFVINVSTLEEVDTDHISIFNRLLFMTKPGGIVICTFDLPGLQLDKFETLFNQKYQENSNHVTPSNSVTNAHYPHPSYMSYNMHLKVGYLVVQK